jgi:hypothetical protein
MERENLFSSSVCYEKLFYGSTISFSTRTSVPSKYFRRREKGGSSKVTFCNLGSLLQTVVISVREALPVPEMCRVSMEVHQKSDSCNSDEYNEYGKKSSATVVNRMFVKKMSSSAVG